MEEFEAHILILYRGISAFENELSDLWPAPPKPLAEIAEHHRERLISATLLLAESANDWLGEPEAYGFRDPAGSRVGNGDATVCSDFHLTPEGVNRLLVVNRELNDYRLGRMARWLLEIETYRMMASLALPLAQELAGELAGLRGRAG